jgi:hypothetical protein
MLDRVNRANPDRVPLKVPVVHLDLGETGQCASAIIGVMSQPTGDKICSMQVFLPPQLQFPPLLSLV